MYALYFTQYSNVIGMTDLYFQGAALGTMVGQLTYGKRQFESVDGTMRQLIPIVHRAMNNFLPLTDADTTAFNQYMVLTDTTSQQRQIFL
jgi:formiminotetrahydrofolate cyclodeaminase